MLITTIIAPTQTRELTRLKLASVRSAQLLEIFGEKKLPESTANNLG
jgi:hypothetical protein